MMLDSKTSNHVRDFALSTWPLSYDFGEVYEPMQMELIEMQCDSVLKEKLHKTGIPTFYTCLSDRFANI